MQCSCKICGNTKSNEQYIFEEKMYATGDSFDYFQCSACKTLQICSIPDNLGMYYPDSYYNSKIKFIASLRNSLRLKRDHHSYGKKNFLGKILVEKIGANCNTAAFRWIQKIINPAHDCKILDVGCGPGNFLLFLDSLGFKNLTGLDPFIQKNNFMGKNKHIQIKKCQLEELNGQYDLIILNHSFEHMPNPQKAFNKLCSSIAPGGHILLRVPIVNWAWKHYRHNWVQIDAPRHIFIPSLKAIKILCRNNGAVAKKVKFDSNAFQFIGSKKYSKGIALNDHLPITNKQKKNYEEQAVDLNKIQQGDQVCFIIAKN
ncbi:MAG: class I SAM-dependent methyltransferase [Lentisphaerae bacterium]|nr:class I SAM-dependent methyltransferase [Lentisphaerota bacterium]MCP4100566.1 class I SAM-dependent methyltransferase [Lentisphaerota bacterium]